MGLFKKFEKGVVVTEKLTWLLLFNPGKAPGFAVEKKYREYGKWKEKRNEEKKEREEKIRTKNSIFQFNPSFLFQWENGFRNGNGFLLFVCLVLSLSLTNFLKRLEPKLGAP